MENYLTVKNLDTLKILPNHTDGEIAFCEDENAFYMYNNGNWDPVKAKMNGDGLELNLYDLNKQIISQMTPIGEDAINAIIDEISNWVRGSNVEYVMLYGREINYFTIFAYREGTEKFSDVLKECLNSVGDIITIEFKDDTNAYEIWMKQNEEVTVLYLFDYSNGVIYFE